MTIPQTETQKAIASAESKKTKFQSEIVGMTDCKNAINAAVTKTAYMDAQILAYTDKIADNTAQITEIDSLIAKLNA